MKRIITAVVLAAALAVAASAQASSITECGWGPGLTPGSPAGIMNLTTRHVSCPNARHFAVQVTARDPRHWDGFACRISFYDQNLSFDIRCTRGRQVIHWQGGD
jgi:hypothetical protein